MSTQPYVEFRNVCKTYDGKHLAADRLDFTIGKGEFLTLLGPSGSGKTTALMMLAGFEAPTSGAIRLNGREIARLPPHKRNMGVVFQNYALFPHMSVADNVAFPLTVRGIGGDELRARVARALELVQLSSFDKRRPAELSGGQQQRVALARALVFNPDVVLMDEPLGALDKNLREQLQLEIKHIQSTLGITVVYVTHDQSEALTMSDRIAVFDRGSIRQIDTPRGLYDDPTSAFVAQFVGQNNSIGGTIESVEDESVQGGSADIPSVRPRRCTARTASGALVHARLVGAGARHDPVILTVRPECVHFSASATRALGAANTFDAHVCEVIYHGDHVRVRVDLAGGGTLFAKAEQWPPAGTASHGDGRVTVSWLPDRCRAFAERPHSSATLAA